MITQESGHRNSNLPMDVHEDTKPSNIFESPPFTSDIANIATCINAALAMDPKDLTEEELESGQIFLQYHANYMNEKIEKYEQPHLLLWSKSPRREASQVIQLLYGVETMLQLQRLKERVEKQARLFYIEEGKFHEIMEHLQ